ncbi:MAG: LysR family transcriptional regulator [Magnetococcales bacterium]|nr:LysR family transcriptional regulator [Magnetococcales bacterium]
MAIVKRGLVNFDLNLLVAFDILMTERGVTRAGKVLGITQAAMSNTLRRLREIFDDPLFVKVGQRMVPTARALELSTPIREALGQVKTVLEQERFEPVGSKQRFRIGMVDYASAMLLPMLLRRLHEQAPEVEVEVVDVGGTGECQELESGTVDLVFSRFQWVSPQLKLHRLFEQHYVCLFRKGHPLIGPSGELTLEAMLAARFVHYFPKGMDTTVVDEALGQMGYQRKIVARLDSFSMVPLLVSSSDMMAVVPEGTARCVLSHLPLVAAALPFDTPRLRMAIAWHPRTDASPPHIWLREQILSLLEGGNCP